jgi:putative ATPase
MDLFDSVLEKNKQYAPLADRMRPLTLDEYIGQEHILGEGKVLRKLIQTDQLHSLILWGPPGVGKTTLASVIAHTTGAHFVSLSAVNTGLKEAREIIASAQERLKFHNKKTILFIDEIHRFNKAQQDAFLPYVENGAIIMIGATTENPSFEVNSALLSRSRVFVLHPHTKESLRAILKKAQNDSEKGLGALSLTIEHQVQDAFIEYSNGDARSLLNIFELASALADEQDGKKNITLEIVQEAAQKKALRYDKTGEEHYNIISAFIKSMRNSDPHAALYWLARMLDAGEDPLFIARRMVVFASEDIGLASANALVLAIATMQAVDFIGMPEARIPLAQCAVYLAEAKKSNRSYAGLNSAMEDVKKMGNLPVPLHLRNAVTKLMKELDYGKGYAYAHDYEDAKTDMECMPEALKNRKYV